MFQHFELNTLYLNGNQLTTVPEGLGSLAHSLRVININENPITELNENSFLGLRNLQQIVASGLSELTTIKANTFSKLENLKTLSCSYNPKLVEIDPYAFWDHNQKFSLQQVRLYKKKYSSHKYVDIIIISMHNKYNIMLHILRPF